MRSQLRRTLHDFLEAEKISLESKIVPYIIYKMIGLVPTEERCARGGLNLQGDYNNEEQIIFSLCNEERLVDLEKIFQLFEFKREDYKHGRDLILDSDYVINTFLPQFKQAYEDLKASNPQLIQFFITQSAPLLESSALNTLQKFSDGAREIFSKNKLRLLTNDEDGLIETLILLEGYVQHIAASPWFYAKILALAPRITSFKDCPAISKDTEVVKKLDGVLEGLKLFNLYYRHAARIGIIKFQNEMTDYLSKKKIGYTLCDIIEHSIFHLAQVKYDHQVNFKHYPGRDNSRLVILIDNMDNENVNQLITYINHLGDPSCCEGYGDRKYSSSVVEKRLYPASGAGRTESTKRQHDVTRRAIELDGAFLYSTLKPLLEKHIDSLSEHVLEPYVQASKKLFSPVSNLSIFSSQFSKLRIQDELPKEEINCSTELG